MFRKKFRLVSSRITYQTEEYYFWTFSPSPLLVGQINLGSEPLTKRFLILIQGGWSCCRPDRYIMSTPSSVWVCSTGTHRNIRDNSLETSFASLTDHLLVIHLCGDMFIRTENYYCKSIQFQLCTYLIFFSSIALRMICWYAYVRLCEPEQLGSTLQMVPVRSFHGIRSPSHQAKAPPRVYSQIGPGRFRERSQSQTGTGCVHMHHSLI